MPDTRRGHGRNGDWEDNMGTYFYIYSTKILYKC